MWLLSSIFFNDFQSSFGRQSFEQLTFWKAEEICVHKSSLETFFIAVFLLSLLTIALKTVFRSFSIFFFESSMSSVKLSTSFLEVFDMFFAIFSIPSSMSSLKLSRAVLDVSTLMLVWIRLSRSTRKGRQARNITMRIPEMILPANSPSSFLNNLALKLN